MQQTNLWHKSDAIHEQSKNRINLLIQKSADSNKLVFRIENEVKDSQAIIKEFPNQYAGKKGFENLFTRFLKFSDIENIKLLEENLLPKLRKFRAEVEEMERNHVEMCENVRKLDESVAMKANKDSFMLFKHEVLDSLVSNE